LPRRNRPPDAVNPPLAIPQSSIHVDAPGGIAGTNHKQHRGYYRHDPREKQQHAKSKRRFEPSASVLPNAHAYQQKVDNIREKQAADRPAPKRSSFR